jgi:tetratricopeptide (TPR) repeat protein
LETIRQYAREKLLEAGGDEVNRDRHLAYFVKLAEQAEPELYRSNQVFWFHKLDDEIDNLRMALEWASVTNVDAGLRIAVALRRFWDSHGHLQEIEDRLGQLLKQHETNDTLLAQSVAVHSYFIFMLGDLLEASRLAEHSLQMARTLSDKHIEALSLYFLGTFNQYQGHMQAGDLFLEQSLALYRALGNKIGQANALEALGMFGNDLERSIIFARDGLDLYRELGNLSGIASILHLLARLTIWCGDFSEPRQWLDEALSISYQLGNDINAADVLVIYGILFYWQGNYQRSIAYYDEASLLIEKFALPGKKVWFQLHKSYAVLRQGDVQQAYKMFEECIWRSPREYWAVFIRHAIEGLASLHVSQNQPERAAQLFAWADAMRDKINNPRPPVEQASVDKDWAIIQSKIDDAEFTRLTAEGRTMTMEQIIALALEV